MSSTSTCRWRTTGRSSPRRARSASRSATCCATRSGLPTFDATLDVEGRPGMGSGDRGAGRAGAAVGPRIGARLPRRHVRLPARRGGAPDHGEVARYVLPRRVRRAPRSRVLDRAPRGAGGPRGAAHRWAGRERRGRPRGRELAPVGDPRARQPARAVIVDERVARRSRARLQHARAARGGDARGQRHHQRAIAGPLLRGAHRHRRRRTAGTAALQRAGRQGPDPPDRGPRPGVVLPGHRRDHDHRPRLLDRLRVRALRWLRRVRALGRRWLGRVRRPRSRHRRGLRDEPDDAGPGRRSALGRVSSRRATRRPAAP